MTAGWFATAASISLLSIARNACSPCSANINEIGRPSLRIRIASMSTKPLCSCSATNRPTVVLPEPGNPIRTTCLLPFMTRPHAALGTAGAVGGAREAGQDPVVHFGALAARRLEAQPQLHALYGGNRHQGLRDTAVELRVP